MNDCLLKLDNMDESMLLQMNVVAQNPQVSSRQQPFLVDPDLDKELEEGDNLGYESEGTSSNNQGQQLQGTPNSNKVKVLEYEGF
jgi:hypothetical protein